MGRAGLRDLTMAQKGEIVGLAKAGMGIRAISRRLNIAASTAHRYVTRYEETGGVETLPWSGCPRSSTLHEDEAIEEAIRESGFTTAGKITRNLRLRCSVQTVRRRLHQAGFKSYKPARKLQMTEDHKRRRLEFARNFLHWDEEWDQTVFVDEKIFSTDMTGKLTLWRERGTRYNEENLAIRDHQGRVTVSIWASMSVGGLGDIVIVEERMNSASYLEILRDIMYPSAVNWFPRSMINLVQDNSGPNSGAIVSQWIA